MFGLRARVYAVAVTAGLVIASGAPAIEAQGRPALPHMATVGWTGSHGYLGINFREVTEEQMGTLQSREARGVEVTQVDHDGPAGKAGIREHDVIQQMNGQLIDGVEKMRRLLRETPAGRTVTLVLSRDGQSQTVTTQLANREELERQAWDQHFAVPAPDPSGGPTPPSRAAGAQSSRAGLGFLGAGAPGASVAHAGNDHPVIGSVMLSPAYTGAALETLGPQLAEFFGAPDGDGLLVRSVEGNSPASVAGLKAGDVVLRLNQMSIATSADWLRVMHESKGRPVQVTVLRERREQTLTLTPDSKHRSGVRMPATSAEKTTASVETPERGWWGGERR